MSKFSAPLRVIHHPNQGSLSSAEDKESDLERYSRALMLLMPAEITALYLTARSIVIGYYRGQQGSGTGQLAAWVAITVVLVIILVVFRIAATSDRKIKVGAEWPAVIITLISFVVWVYAFGDLSAALGIWHPLVSTLVVLFWTFLAPLVYVKRRARR